MAGNAFSMRPFTATPEMTVTDPRLGRQPLDLHRASVRILDPRPAPFFSVTPAGVATWQADLELQMYVGAEQRQMSGTLTGPIVNLLFPMAFVHAITLMAIIADKGLGHVNLVGVVPVETRHVRRTWRLII
jgi:hypothetical protein